MSIDVVSYSKMMGEDEEGTLRLLDTHRAYIDNSIRNYRGRIANTAGDSVLAEFASPLDAVRCGVEIQDNVVSLNSRLPANRHMQLRVGIHVDDIIVQPTGDLIGEGVNIAARLQSAAEPGGIAVSGDVVTQTRAKLADVSFVPMANAVFKNILRAVEPFHVAKEAGAPGRTAVGVSVRPTTDPPRQSFPVRWPLVLAICFCVAILIAVSGYFILRESPAAVAERTAWMQLRENGSIADITAFLERYPRGANAAAARARLASLRDEQAERLAREQARREAAEKAARDKAEADERRRQEQEARAAEAARAADAARQALERQRREDLERAEVRRQTDAQRLERRIEAIRKLEFKPIPCSQSKLVTTAGLNCSASQIYEGLDGRGRFRRWAAGSHSSVLATYIVVVEAVDPISVHDPVTKQDEETWLVEISNVTRFNAMRWSDIEASAAGFTAHFTTFDRGDCAAFTKPGPVRNQGLVWVIRGYACLYSGQPMSPERIRAILEAQKINQ